MLAFERVKKHFNTAGPCRADWHYMVPPLPRVPEAPGLVEGGAYFVIHAPRQSGKTTFLRAFARELTAKGELSAVYASCEAAEAMGEDVVAAQAVIVRRLEVEAEAQLPEELRPAPFSTDTPETRFGDFLAHWSRGSRRKLVLLLDEVDALRGQSLLAVLRQLRTAFPDRPEWAPWSVVLCGLRDVRDYKVASGGDALRLGTSSPFNIEVESLRIGDFDDEDVKDLLGQHERETGQAFDEAASARLMELAGGQPWLVNALAREVIDKMAVVGTITLEHVEQAKERLVLARATHLDSLVSTLTDSRVRRVLEPIVAGEEPPFDAAFDDDVSYVLDLGLVKPRPLRVANPIYTEVIGRVLSDGIQRRVHADPRSFVRADGTLDLDVLVREFAAFWIEQGDVLVDGATYREAGAQLVLMAVLQRVVNGGGTVSREYGAGRKRLDLLVAWPHLDASGRRVVQREAIECKVWRDGKKDPLAEGLVQLEGYLDRVGLERGLLVLFDRRAGAGPIEQRTREEQAATAKGRPVRVLRA